MTPNGLNFTMGTLCIVEQVSPVGQELLVMVKAINRVQIGPLVATEPYMTAEIVELPETYTESDRSLATARQIMVEFKRVFNMGKSIEFSLFMRLMGGGFSARAG